MRLERGLHLLWPGFAIELKEELTFHPGVYHLSGENGSGKSSFYKRLLLPELQTESSCYIVYLEQMMKGQFYALKAHAALSDWQKGIHNHQDAVDYLLHDLGRTVAKSPRSIFAMVDESSSLIEVWDRLKGLGQSFTLIYSSHRAEAIQADYVLSLEPINQEGSILYERTL